MAPLLAQARARQRKLGVPIPPSIDPGPEPRVRSELLWYLAAFDALSTCRPQIVIVGPGGATARPGPIPWTAIRAYAESRRLEPDVAEAFEDVIARLDAAELKDMRERATSPASSPPAPAPGATPPTRSRRRR